MLQVAGGGAAAAAAAGALYGGLALITHPPTRAVSPPRGGYPDTQYAVLDYGVRVRPDPASAVDVVIPPIWNMVITTKLARTPGVREQQRLEAALRAVEAVYPYSPSGVFIVVAYGLPYFRQHVRSQVFAAHLPRMTSGERGQPPVGGDDVPALLDAVRFPSDPAGTVLEANDLALHLRSDALDHLRDVQHALFANSGTLAGQATRVADLSDLFHVTSVRTGFVGAGMPRQMAQQARLAYAEKIAADAPLFMGFTSSQQQGQAKEETVSFDGQRDPLLPPLTTAKPGDYFAAGTALHLSHLTEDLASWYAMPYEQRVARMFHLNAVAPAGRVAVQTLWLNPNTAVPDAQQHQMIGHNEAVQRSSRSAEGQALQLRVDFNTMDALDATSPSPGVHFLAFTPGSQVFHQSRQAMDATDLAQSYQVPATANGINAFIKATRRQNFLVPPRRHRAFPLVEVTG
jgi:hypothetical protein